MIHKAIQCDVENTSSACHLFRMKKIASRLLKLLKFKFGFERNKSEVEKLPKDKGVFNKSLIIVAIDMHLAMDSAMCCM